MSMKIFVIVSLLLGSLLHAEMKPDAKGIYTIVEDSSMIIKGSKNGMLEIKYKIVEGKRSRLVLTRKQASILFRALTSGAGKAIEFTDVNGQRISITPVDGGLKLESDYFSRQTKNAEGKIVTHYGYQIRAEITGTSAEELRRKLIEYGKIINKKEP